MFTFSGTVVPLGHDVLVGGANWSQRASWVCFVRKISYFIHSIVICLHSVEFGARSAQIAYLTLTFLQISILTHITHSCPNISNRALISPFRGTKVQMTLTFLQIPILTHITHSCLNISNRALIRPFRGTKVQMTLTFPQMTFPTHVTTLHAINPNRALIEPIVAQLAHLAARSTLTPKQPHNINKHPTKAQPSHNYPYLPKIPYYPTMPLLVPQKMASENMPNIFPYNPYIRNATSYMYCLSVRKSVFWP